MRRKQLILIAVAVVLGGLCLYLNRDWFASESIQIYSRAGRGMGFFRRGRPDNAGGMSVIFGFSQKLKLTAVKVIPVSAMATNKYPHPIWEMISESNSVPTKGFSYGMYIPGMHPKVKGAQPDPLQPGVKYKLFVEAGTLKGEHEFEGPARAP